MKSKRTPWWERMHRAIKHLHAHHVCVDGKYYSFSGGPMSHPLVRNRLIEDGAITRIGRFYKRQESAYYPSSLRGGIESALNKKEARTGERDHFRYHRTLFRLNPPRLDELNCQLLRQKPKLSARKTHTGQLVLQFDEEEGVRPDFRWNEL